MSFKDVIVVIIEAVKFDEPLRCVVETIEHVGADEIDEHRCGQLSMQLDRTNIES